MSTFEKSMGVIEAEARFEHTINPTTGERAVDPETVVDRVMDFQPQAVRYLLLTLIEIHDAIVRDCAERTLLAALDKFSTEHNYDREMSKQAFEQVINERLRGMTKDVDLMFRAAQA